MNFGKQWELSQMLKPKVVSSFKKDLKKYKHKQDIIEIFNEILKKLLTRRELDHKYRDHPLAGDWIGSRECHIKPDTLLVYSIDEANNLLILERLGSHSELFK